jgi:lipopolysaccharide transport system permease protein
MIADTWRRRTLVLSLVRRQYQLRYRQSLAGISWAVVPPIAGLVVATVVFHGVLKVDIGDVPYPLFALSGLAPWAFFAGVLSSGVPSITTQQTMVTRLAFPRAAIPLSIVGVGLIDLGITSVLFVGFAIVSGEGLPLSALWAPVLLLIEIAFVTGVILLGSALNVFARDIRLAVPLIVQLWLYLTPVMYPLSTVPDELRTLYMLNPMSGLIESFHTVLIDAPAAGWGGAPDLSVLLPSIIGAVSALVVGIWYFGSTEPRFADVI